MADSPWSKKDVTGWGEAKPADDPSVRERYDPTATGPGDGTVFFFLFGLKLKREIDQQFVAREREAIVDDIEVLRAAGYTVVVDPQATRQDLYDALSGAAEGPPVGIYWSAHGHSDGSVETCDGGLVKPEEVAENVETADTMRLFVMSACYSAARSRTWRKAMGGHPLVVGWGRPVTIDRAVDFLTPRDETDTDLDDLIRRYLVQRHPVPELGEAVDDQPAWTRGELEPVQPRVKALCDVLGAASREHDGAIELQVPTGGKRRQVVRLTAVESDQPFTEGKRLLCVESVVGELTAVIQPKDLLRHSAAPGFCRTVLVEGPADLPVILVQGFALLDSDDHALAGVIQEVSLRADALEDRIFGGDLR